MVSHCCFFFVRMIPDVLIQYISSHFHHFPLKEMNAKDLISLDKAEGENVWNFIAITGADPGFLLGGGCTRLLLYFNTNKPNSFFLQNTSCTRKPQVISAGGGGGGGRTPCILPLDPPLNKNNNNRNISICERSNQLKFWNYCWIPARAAT